MTSPEYSALPQELLLEVDPRRPEIKPLPVTETSQRHQTDTNREKTKKYWCQMSERGEKNKWKKENIFSSIIAKFAVTHFYNNHVWPRGNRWMELLPFSPTLAGKPLKDGKW